MQNLYWSQGRSLGEYGQKFNLDFSHLNKDIQNMLSKLGENMLAKEKVTALNEF